MALATTATVSKELCGRVDLAEHQPTYYLHCDKPVPYRLGCISVSNSHLTGVCGTTQSCIDALCLYPTSMAFRTAS